MTAERWELVKNVFESALTVSPAERASFLERECAGDEEVRREVASLLSSLDESSEFLEEPLVSVKQVINVPDAPPNLAGVRVGAYELVREIGRGGMGSVYLAVRADNEFQKRVAIKLIRGGMESDFLIRRFRNERQILARLEHPNIARLIDGGATADGLPYFVMEYVEGEPLNQYCESRKLPLRERTEIFLKACQAVHYAHRRMIVHRDLKPGNILVKDDGTPKLLDFGIAKLLNPDTDQPGGSETTMGGFRIATPAYASPEQMRGERATICSDIYALGIILFELMSGKRPSSIAGEDPLALHDSTADDDARVLARKLRAVVHKAVQPDPRERYESVETFTADIQACLAGGEIPNYSAAPTVMEQVASPGSVAVLPFRLLGTDSTSEGYLGLGITDALITKLSNVGRISVRSTSAVMKYAAIPDAIMAGRELGVEFVLEGRIQKIEDRVRVTVQLVHVQTDAPVWAGSFDDKFADLLRVEDSISEQVARALVPQLTGEEREQLARGGTRSAKAHQAYLRGRWHWSRGSDEALAQALVAFMQAIAEDPAYALAHAGVADYYVQLGIRGGLPPAESFAAAKESANTALRLDQSLAEAHASLAFALWAYDRDYAAAGHHLQLAIALNPDYSSAHHWLGLLNSSRGRPEMAIACLERARKLDPNRIVYAAHLAACYYNSRRYSKAIEVCQQAIHKLGDSPELYSLMAMCYRFEGKFDRATEAAERAVGLSGEDIFDAAVVAEVEAAKGDRNKPRELLKAMERRAETAYVSGCVLARLHLACGERDKALLELERAWRDRDWWVMWLAVMPSWDPLRGERRFQKLLLTQPAPAVPGVEDGEQITSRILPQRRRLWWAGAIAAVALIIVVSSILAFRVFWPGPPPFQRPAIAKLTTNGTAQRAAISADGRFIAYTAGALGNLNLYVRELSGSNAYQIAGPFAGEIRSIEFIRNGRFVSFVEYAMNEPAKGNLYAAPIVKGQLETMMADVPGPVTVSPDGSKVAFFRANPKEARDDLVLRNPDGSGERIIASQRYPDRFSFNAAPMWSPDGRRLACATEGTDASGFRVALATVDLNGQITNVSSPRWQWVGRVAWLGKSNAFLVIGQEVDSSFQQIWYIPPRGSAFRLTNDLSDYYSLASTADGSAVTSVQVQTVTNVYILKANDPSHGIQITPGGGRYFDLSWSPTGKILYASDASGSADIWMMNPDGSEQEQLTKGVGRSYSPGISPDGQTVAFHSNRDGNWNLWTLNLKSRTAIQVTTGTQDSNWPVFTPDGNQLVYHHTGLNAMFNIWRTPASGGQSVQLTRDLTMHPAVSEKDGRIAAWYSQDVAKPVWKIAIFNPEGGDPVQLFDAASTVRPDTALKWTPQSDAITYLDERNGVTNIWLQPLNGKPARPLTTFTWGAVFSFDWSRDGRLVYSRGMTSNDVVLIKDTSKRATSPAR